LKPIWQVQRKTMYKLSRYWNRLAYFFIHLGRRMIWDQTKKNADLLEDFPDEYTEAIMCDR